MTTTMTHAFSAFWDKGTAMAMTTPSSGTAGGAMYTSDETVFAAINLNSGTMVPAANTLATNNTTAPVSYTFVSNSDQHSRIFSAQCARVGAYIYDQLDRLDKNDDYHNEETVEKIASVINMVGEPAYMTAKLEAQILSNDRFRLGKLLLAIATSTHKETENERAELLRHYLSVSDYRIKNDVIRALGRMKTDGSKRALKELSDRHEKGEISYLAAAMLR